MFDRAWAEHWRRFWRRKRKRMFLRVWSWRRRIVQRIQGWRKHELPILKRWVSNLPIHKRWVSNHKGRKRKKLPIAVRHHVVVVLPMEDDSVHIGLGRIQLRRPFHCCNKLGHDGVVLVANHIGDVVMWMCCGDFQGIKPLIIRGCGVRALAEVKALVDVHLLKLKLGCI